MNLSMQAKHAIMLSTIGVLVVVAIVLGVMLYRCKHDKVTKEGLCLCTGLGVQKCVSRKEQMLRYNQGRTENTIVGDVPQYQRDAANPPYNY